MRSLKILALVAVATTLSAAGHVRAADMPEYLPPPPIQEYGGWYLRGDIGMTNQRVRSLDNALFATAVNLQIHDLNFEAGMLFGVGVGYRHNSWFRWDLTGEYRGEAGFHGFDTYGLPVDGYNNYTAKKSEWLLMWNAYLDLGTWKGITPFVGAGVGMSRIGIHSFRDIGVGPGGVPTGAYANSDYTWNFAWALHAGVAYNVTPDFTVEFAYRYVHLGHGKSGDLITYTGVNAVNNPMHFRNITSHDIKLGVRMALADLGVSHWAPPPPPIISKY